MKKQINISDIKASFGGDKEPKDELLVNLLKEAYSGKLPVRVAEVKVEGIKPFSLYKPNVSDEYRKYFEDKIREGNPPPIYVYPQDGFFIMSDDYNAFSLYQEKKYLNIICVVLGDAVGEYIIECSEPFKLPPPTIEDISKNNQPNLNVSLGTDDQGKEINVDFGQENIHFTILTGSTGSGKSVFHYNLYKQLIEQNSTEDIGFIFYDMTRVDFAGWKSPYVMEIEVSSEKALDKFEQIGGIKTDKTIFIHIEECDMVAYDALRFEKALTNVLKHGNIYVIFSTSRPSIDVLTETIRNLADLTVVFNLSTKVDSTFVLGESLAETFTEPGQRVLAFKDKKIVCKPFTEAELQAVEKYFE